jgi:hypothetical protein
MFFESYFGVLVIHLVFLAIKDVNKKTNRGAERGFTGKRKKRKQQRRYISADSVHISRENRKKENQNDI